jgi:hypothetical protein
MTIRMVRIAPVLLLLACCTRQPPVEPDKAARPAVSRFHSLELEVGMERQKVEEQVASLLSRQNRYSPYGNNLTGGVVEYRDGDWVLEVTYKAGAPAPWVETPDGSMQHLPPIDETVLEYRIERIPDKEQESPQ